MRLEEYTISWTLWFFALLAVVGLYFVLRLLANILDRVNVLGKRQRPAREVLNVVLRLYEPAASLFLLVGFVFINILLHGLLVIFVFILAFYPVKNYVNGRLFLLAHKLQEGQRIRVNEMSGIIRDLGRLGVSLQTSEGLRFINYTTLLSDGYLLLKGEKIGRLHQLSISSGAEIEALTVSSLKNRLFSCPYIDWSLRPEIKEDDEGKGGLLAQVLVREDAHLRSLVELVREWGYGCVVVG
ncbi:MAG: hypothetical protein ACI8YQ_000380 [Polaribacter sp.]|jgi:hypothetical protein